VALLDVDLAGTVEVLELLVAQAEIRQPAVADLPAVFDELRFLLHLH